MRIGSAIGHRLQSGATMTGGHAAVGSDVIVGKNPGNDAHASWGNIKHYATKRDDLFKP